MRLMAKRFSLRNLFTFLMIIFIITFCYTIGRKQLNYFLDTRYDNTIKSDDSLQLTLEEVPEPIIDNKNQHNSIPERSLQASPNILQAKFNAPQVQFTLVVSSLGRSGTSWIGELLFSTQKRSFYVYEPDYYIVNVLNRTMNNMEGINVIRSQFLCDFSEDFISFVRINKTDPSHTFRSLYTKYCRDKNICLTTHNINNNCLRSTKRIIKTIRFGLEFAGKLLTDHSLQNLKVIYIVRDPRAALASRERLGWTADPVKNCDILEEDLKWYKILKNQFPDKIYLLRYENICLNVSGDGSRLWQFLSGNTEEQMPESWTRFFVQHSEPPKEEFPYQVRRDPKTEWFNWRTELQNETQLKVIENFCQNSIMEFGYNIFGSLDVAKNLTFSSLTSVQKCPQIPCHYETFLKDDI